MPSLRLPFALTLGLAATIAACGDVAPPTGGIFGSSPCKLLEACCGLLTAPSEAADKLACEAIAAKYTTAEDQKTCQSSLTQLGARCAPKQPVGQAGAAGQAQGGAAGAPGGMTSTGGTSTGGTSTGGSPSGGSAGSPFGGSAGSPSGGSAGSPFGGSAGSPSGGSAGKGGSGSAGKAGSGSAGKAGSGGTSSGCAAWNLVPGACDACIESSCCGQATACVNDVTCKTLMICMSGCTSQTCQSKCSTSYPSGIPAYNAVIDCANAGCSSACSGSSDECTGTCAHSACSMGTKLTSSCSTCAQKVCASDSFCCTNTWDDMCVSKAQSLCTCC